MQADVPIQIEAISQRLLADKKLIQVLTQLEAWLNFQGLSANWYQDESAIIRHRFELMDQADFERFIAEQGSDFKPLKLKQRTTKQLESKQEAQSDNKVYQAVYCQQQSLIRVLVLLDDDSLGQCLFKPFNQNPLNAVLLELARRTRRA